MINTCDQHALWRVSFHNSIQTDDCLAQGFRIFDSKRKAGGKWWLQMILNTKNQHPIVNREKINMNYWKSNSNYKYTVKCSILSNNDNQGNFHFSLTENKIYENEMHKCLWKAIDKISYNTNMKMFSWNAKFQTNKPTIQTEKSYEFQKELKCKAAITRTKTILIEINFHDN